MRKKLMKKFFYNALTVIMTLVTLIVAMACRNTYNSVYKSDDYIYKYEYVKELYFRGKYIQCSELLEQMVMLFKGTDKAEESLFLNAMCYYHVKDYETASLYFDKYVQSYPKGTYAEDARYFNGLSSYFQSPDPRLDQTPTYTAIKELQSFIEFFPYSDKREKATTLLYKLQDRLVQKEYESALLYFKLGDYVGNCANGGSNFEACIITAENALKNYPYTEYREDLFMMILRSRFRLAKNSVAEKAEERYRQTIDEYYGFRNEYPESKYMKEADLIFRQCDAKVKKIEYKLNKLEEKLMKTAEETKTDEK